MDEATRLDLWEALSDLFRDTELTDHDVRHIARVIRGSGVPVPEVEAILWNEVFPVLHPNLRSVTGVWTGWSREWLRAHLQPSAGPPRPRGPRSALRDIRQEWDRVRTLLSGLDPLHPPGHTPHSRGSMMNRDQARSIAEAMVTLWEDEFPSTLRVLSAVSDERRDYRPDPKSRSAWELLTHMATADAWFLDSVVQGSFQYDPEKANAVEAGFTSASQVVAFYTEAVPARLAALRALSDEELAQDLDFFGMMNKPRAAWIGFANNHSVHHRGQLSTHLRAMGCKVPDIYGPSGDSETPESPA